MSIPRLRARSKDRDALLRLQEGHFVDLKSRRTPPRDLQKHLVAFANTDGGDIYIGIEDPKVRGPRLRGFRKPEDANDVIHALSEVTPTVDGVDFEFIECQPGGLVVHVSIPKSPKVHYTADNECYIRRNASTRRIKGDQITRLAYAKGSFSYENQPVDTALDTITDSAELKAYVDRIGTALEVPTFLKKQRLVVDANGGLRPTVGAVLLFDEEPQATLDTRCAIKVYRLNTTDREYKREHLAGPATTIEGPLEKQIRAVIDRVNSLLANVSYKVGGNLVKLKYPSEALFEILVNAVIHRDYSINDDVHVRVYDNRIEVQSPGRLPGSVTVENLLDERYARNPKVVRMLHKLPDPVNHDIGEGLNTAKNALHRAGLVPPSFQELENAFLVTVEHRRIASLEDMIIDYLRNNDTVTNKVIRQLSGEASENKVKKAFQTLRAKDVVQPIDPNASAFQFVYRKGPRFPNGKPSSL
jgi:ATP-dependent DNA helicase RecG